MSKHLNVILLAVAFALTGCSEDSDTQHSDSLKANSTRSFTERYSFEFSENGCSTGEHSYTSLESMCKELQNTTVNNGCALESRKEHFEQNCSGSFESTPEMSKQSAKTPEVSEFQERKLKLNTSVIDVIRLSSNGSDGVSQIYSDMTSFSCLDDMSVRGSVNNGFTLLNDSKVSVNRDVMYVFGDGSNAFGHSPYVFFTCEKDEEALSDDDHLNKNDFKLKKLKLNQSIVVSVVLTPEKVYESVLKTTIKCVDNAQDTLKHKNFILLFKGSRLVVKQDTNERKDQMLISCE